MYKHQQGFNWNQNQQNRSSPAQTQNQGQTQGQGQPSNHNQNQNQWVMQGFNQQQNRGVKPRTTGIAIKAGTTIKDNNNNNNNNNNNKGNPEWIPLRPTWPKPMLRYSLCWNKSGRWLTPVKPEAKGSSNAPPRNEHSRGAVKPRTITKGAQWEATHYF